MTELKKPLRLLTLLSEHRVALIFPEVVCVSRTVKPVGNLPNGSCVNAKVCWSTLAWGDRLFDMHRAIFPQSCQPGCTRRPCHCHISVRYRPFRVAHFSYLRASSWHYHSKRKNFSCTCTCRKCPIPRHAKGNLWNDESNNYIFGTSNFSPL